MNHHLHRPFAVSLPSLSAAKRSSLQPIAGLVILVCLLCSPQKIDAQGAATKLAEGTDVVAVEIPVQVLLDGEPLRGLERANFQVLEGRKPQPIVDFEVIDVSVFEAPEASPRAADPSAIAESPTTMPALSARRHILLLFDLSFSAPESIVQAQEAALELVRDSLHASDLVAVATYSTLDGPRLLHTFTPDRKQAALAIETLGLPQLTRPVSDPLGLIFGDLEAAERGFSSGRAGGLVSETLKDFARLMERQDKRRYEEQVHRMTQSMGDLAKLLRNAPGRKHVLFLSEGFDTSVFFGDEDLNSRNVQNQALESGRVWEVSSEERFGDSSAQNALEDMFREFRRADCRIDTVDIGRIQASTDAAAGGRRATERRNTTRRGRQDGLAMLAGSTGGSFVRNHNDLSQAMREVQRRTSLTYLLTIQPRDIAQDGSYRRLKVRLKDVPKGVEVVHRPGYFAPLPWDETSPGGRQLIAAGRLLDSEQGGALSLGLTASALPTADSTAGAAVIAPKAYVPLMIEIDGPPLIAASGEATSMTGQIFLYVMDGAGQVRAYLDHAIAVDLGQAGATLAAGGLKFFGDLELSPGNYVLRAFVRHQGSDQNGFASLRLRVPDFAGGEAGALPPLFPEPPGRWMMLREKAVAGVTPPPFPYLNGQQPFLPAARPTFTPGRIDVAVALHNLAPGSPALEGRVLNAAEQPTRAKVQPLEPKPQVDPERPGLSRWPLQLDARRLTPGSYTLEVTVRDAAGLHSVQRSSFQIEGPNTP